MAVLKINYNIIILFCILFMIHACNKTVPKIVVENKDQTKFIKKNEQLVIKKDYTSNKIVKKISINKIILDDKLVGNDVVFEFRNERLLQGREIKKPTVNKKTNKALTAVFKMLKQNLSSDDIELNLRDNGVISKQIKYVKNSKNILVFLPLTGEHSIFGVKIRKSLDLSMLRFGSKDTKIIYYDTGKTNYELGLRDLLKTVKPLFVIGPFTRASLLKIKPYIKEKSIPMFTFSNDIALIESNIWSLGFSPEEQVDSVIRCALKHDFRKFGLIAPNNLYGNIILDRSVGLINDNKKNSFESLRLSNKQINNKSELLIILKRFLNYSENKNFNHSKFDAIFIGGNPKFILEIAPLLAFYDVDSKKVQILGTEKFNLAEIKNEPSLEKAWFPKIISQNRKDFKLIWKSSWRENDDYFTYAGFDSGLLAINFLNQKKPVNDYLKDVKSLVTGFVFNPNGSVKKPVSVMQIEKLGKPKKIKNCDDFN